MECVHIINNMIEQEQKEQQHMKQKKEHGPRKSSCTVTKMKSNLSHCWVPCCHDLNEINTEYNLISEQNQILNISCQLKHPKLRTLYSTKRLENVHYHTMLHREVTNRSKISIIHHIRLIWIVQTSIKQIL